MWWINPPKREPANHPVVAFDVETVGDVRCFVHGVVVDWEGAYHFDQAKEMREYLTSERFEGAHVYATNLEYDLTMVFEGFEYGIEPLYYRSRLISARYRRPHRKQIKFLDTSNLTNKMSVDRMGQIVGAPKLETPPSLIEGREGGEGWVCDRHGIEYCVPCYCERDTRVTYRFALMFQSLCSELGCEVKSTVGSTGIDLWRREYLPDKFGRPPLNYNQWGRKAYHGGLTLNLVEGRVEGVSGYDVNSLYPWIHVTGDFPHPNHLRHAYDVWPGGAWLDYEGVAKVRVKVPPIDLPPLPVTYNFRLYYPTGELEGVWTLVELRELVRLGGSIEEVEWVVYSTETCRPLVDYMQAVYGKRLEYQREGSPMEKVVKLLLNAPTGKFGQGTEGGLYYIRSLDVYDDLEEIEGKRVIHLPPNFYVCEPVNIPHDPVYINTLWASQMTALARLYLMRCARQADGEVFYMDTDSLHLRGKLPTGDGLGEWKREFADRAVVYRGPKYYYSDDDKEPRFSKVRGIPSELQREFIEKGKVTMKLTAHPRTAERRGMTINQWYEMEKRDRENFPKRKQGERVSEGGDYYRTEPFTMGEVEELLRDANPPMLEIF